MLNYSEDVLSDPFMNDDSQDSQAIMNDTLSEYQSNGM